MRRTVVIDCFPDSAFRHRERAAVACIDVMLATTTLVTAAAEGRRVRVAASLQEMRALSAGVRDPIVAGSLEGAAPGTFSTTDGPCALHRQSGSTRPLVLASLPGTELVANAAAGGTVFLGCFRNLSATASALSRHDRVALLAAGWHEEFSCEDQMAAAWIAERLLQLGFESEDRHTDGIVRRWSGISPALAGWGNSASQLRREGRGQEVEFVLNHVDDLGHSCICDGSEVHAREVATRAAVQERAG